MGNVVRGVEVGNVVKALFALELSGFESAVAATKMYIGKTLCTECAPVDQNRT